MIPSASACRFDTVEIGDKAGAAETSDDERRRAGTKVARRKNMVLRMGWVGLRLGGVR